MNYLEAKKISDELNKKVDETSSALNSEKYTKHKTSMGLIPDSIRQTDEWKKDKLAFNVAFKNLRNFNKIFVKTFKKEIIAERQDPNFRYKKNSK